MENWKQIIPKYPTGKEGSFVASNREENPIRMQFFIDEKIKNHLYAKIFFKTASEGPPGHVHGGCQAAVLDEMMGSCGWQWGLNVVAAKIDVQFLNMPSSNQEILSEAKIIKQEDRKVFVEAKLYNNQTVYSKSNGLFMVLSDEKLAQLKQKIKP